MSTPTLRDRKSSFVPNMPDIAFVGYFPIIQKGKGPKL